MANNLREKSLLQGTITRITYQDAEAPYTVARLEVDDVEEITVVGGIFPVSEGEEIKVGGSWKVHPRYGLQFQAEHWEKIEPATLAGIEKYLGSGLIKGIGPSYAKRLVAAFGLNTLKVLTDEPSKVMKVSGIGRIRAARILRAWREQRGMQDVMVFLQGHGVGSSLALKIYRAFGAETVARVKENPYCLAEEIYGVGFILADRIASTLGISGDFPLRVQAGLMHVLKKFADDGHCFVPLKSLKANAAALLQVDEDVAEHAVGKLAFQGKLVVDERGDDEDKRVYPRELYEAERRAAAHIQRLLASPSGIKGLKAFNLTSLQRFESASVLLEPEQRDAITHALSQKMLVITGGPGTGKTTLLIALLKILKRAEVSFALAAPTGRAAKRMAELSGEEARTIHRLLEYNPHEGGFQRDEGDPIQASVIVVDEASMLDLPLFDHLLTAVAPESHLVLVGDVDQLPSVGPGSVLRDLIDSKAVPVVVLKRIFRQAGESLIVQNAHRILRGEQLTLDADADRRDFVFIAREREEDALGVIQELVKERIPRRLGVDGAQDIQLLSPMHRGLLGTVNLNRELQRLLNPAGLSIERGGTTFRLNDRVMQLRNNYDKGIFNGDLGKIAAVNIEEGELTVDFDGKRIPYGADDLDEIGLAYAISVHKSQGSEYPVVVIPLHTAHFPMLHRSILYTAVTRGRELVVLVGSKRAVAMAIRNIRIEKRFTGLKEKLAAKTA
ncbi:MAG TPA: ATP-dependent RecD-like DNA helicase [Candidatus Binatia bacterium]|nr:ATP-dependent RecD-like DNA helicase [Candidatus Binatia bacterium]